MQVTAVDIWEQRDDLYSLDYAPAAGEQGLIALGHHALGLTALDGRGQLLWRLGPRDGLTGEGRHPSAGSRTWHATISPDGRTIYAVALGGVARGRRAEIVAIDARLGKPTKSVEVTGRVTLLARLPAPLTVAAVAHKARPGEPSCRLIGFDAGLTRRGMDPALPAGRHDHGDRGRAARRPRWSWARTRASCGGSALSRAGSWPVTTCSFRRPCCRWPWRRPARLRRGWRTGRWRSWSGCRKRHNGAADER